LSASKTDTDEAARNALSIFSEAYWPPLYTFVRRRGYSPSDAQDLVQGFFARLLEQNDLSDADKEKGKLRTFLLTALQHFLYNQYNRAQALKRGGSKHIVSIDDYLPEAEASMMDAAHLSDAACYDLVWSSNMVKRAWQHLQNQFEAEGRAQALEVLKPFLAGGGQTPPSQEEAAARLGVPIATLRVWLSRLRQRYGEALRTEVASTVSDPADVDQEFRYLCQMLLA
jgi:RNA polymerase sigma-70 factor (ECF subfamily)